MNSEDADSSDLIKKSQKEFLNLMKIFLKKRKDVLIRKFMEVYLEESSEKFLRESRKEMNF